MTDWREAGRKADAHRIRDLYRGTFASDSKSIARRRVIEAMRAAGVTTVLDLWGGGVSARDLTAAGFRVISVDDGSMELTDQDRPVSRARKRRALEYTAAEDGYEARFGKAETFANEADGAYLDFCGPWTTNTRRTVVACRHMKAVAVTLTPDHDASSGASNSHERQMAYQMFLKMSWSDKPRWEAMASSGHVRRLLDYRRSGGFAVFLYLLSHSWLRIPSVLLTDRIKTSPAIHERVKAHARAYYYRNRERILARQKHVPVTARCKRCDAQFLKATARKYCSDRCAAATHYEQSRALLQRKLSGVSGTPDEAISD